MEIKIELIGNNTDSAPTKATEGAACFDAYASEIRVKPDGLVIYKLGFKTEFPPTIEGEVLARSGLTEHPFVIANGLGVIDSDYRGEWQFRIRPIPHEQLSYGFGPNSLGGFSKMHLPYQIGERCCQIRFKEVLPIRFEVVESVSESDRGDGGFGHTGK